MTHRIWSENAQYIPGPNLRLHSLAQAFCQSLSRVGCSAKTLRLRSPRRQTTAHLSTGFSSTNLKSLNAGLTSKHLLPIHIAPNSNSSFPVAKMVSWPMLSNTNHVFWPLPPLSGTSGSEPPSALITISHVSCPQRPGFLNRAPLCKRSYSSRHAGAIIARDGGGSPWPTRSRPVGVRYLCDTSRMVRCRCCLRKSGPRRTS